MRRGVLTAAFGLLDGAEQGKVDAGRDLVLDGDYAGEHVFKATHGIRVWGPESYEVDNGQTVVFRIQQERPRSSYRLV